jgi:D-cysteine desulfhydrase
MGAPTMGRRAWLAAAAAACTEAREREPEGSGRASTAPSAAPPKSAAASATSVPAGPTRDDAAPAVPRLELGSWPTPVEEAPALARALGVSELWIKRDDLSSPLFGGGKVRKLERLLADARGRGCLRVITFGAVGSNHAVATAAFGAREGFSVTVRLAGQPRGPVVARNLAACARFGARIEAVGGLADAFERASRAALEEPAGTRPYVIGPGGTSELGNLGMMDAGLELAGQVARGELPAPDVVVLAMGTMGSAVGIAAGLGAAGLRCRIVAVRCSSLASSSDAGYARAVETFGRELAARGMAARFAEVVLEHGALGAGYGVATRDAERAVVLAREHAGLSLETTYTGKAMAALAARGTKLGPRVLFWASQPQPLDVDPSKVDRRTVPRSLWRYLEA